MSAPDPTPPAVVHVHLTVRTALLGVLTVAAVWLFMQLWPVLLVVVVAMMIVGLLGPFVQRLESRGLRRSLAIAIVFGTLFLTIAGFCALTLPRIATQAAELVDTLPASRERIARQLAHWKLGAPLASSLRAMDPAALSAKAKEYGLSYGPRALEAVAYAVSAGFLALYLIIDRDRMRGALFAWVPRAYHLRLSRVLLNLETIVGGYLRGQAVTSALMACFTFIVLMIAGVPNALALALFAGLVDVLPYIGALLACGPAFLAALAKGPTIAVIVLVVLALYQELESRVLVPRIYGKVLRLPAATVMIALLVGGKLLGILGALLALPIAAGVRMVIDELRVALPGEDVDDSAVRAEDAEAEAEFAERAAGKPAEAAAAIATELAAEQRAKHPEGEEAAALEPITSGETGEK